MTIAKQLMQLSEIIDQIEENGGEITNELLPLLKTTELRLADKVDNYVNFRDVVQAQIDRTKKNIDNFKKQLLTLEALETKLKNNVKHLMEFHDLVKIDGNERSIKLVNSGGQQATEKPEDMFLKIEVVNTKYIDELKDLDIIWPEKVYVIKDKDKFNQLVKDNKIKSCYLLPRGKYVKFV